MLQHSIRVVDQFGSQLSIQATFHRNLAQPYALNHLKHITVDGEDIRPSFEMLFQSTITTKIYRIVS